MSSIVSQSRFIALCTALAISAVFSPLALSQPSLKESSAQTLPNDRIYLKVKHGHDISTALQKAVNKISGYREDVATDERAGKVILPAGIFYLSSTINVPSYVTIEGAGIESTYLVRFKDYGDTIVIGNDSGACAVGVTIKDLTLMHGIGQFENGRDESAFQNPVTPGSAHIRAWSPIRCRFENLYLLNNNLGIVIYGGSTNTIRYCTIRGLYDGERPKLKHSASAILIDSSPADNNHPTDTHIEGCSIVGYLSAPRPKAIQAALGSAKIPVRPQNIGYRYGIHVRSSEVLHITGGNIGGCYDSGIFLEPQVGKPLLNVMLQSIFFDGNGQRAIWIYTDQPEVLYNTGIVNCVFIGQANSEAAIVTKYNPKSLTCISLSISNNSFTSYTVTPIFIDAGRGINISANVVRSYNTHNLFPDDSKLGAGIYVGPSADCVSISNNIIGGGNALEKYNLTRTVDGDYLSACAYGIVVDSAKTVQVVSNLNAGTNPAKDFEIVARRAKAALGQPRVK